MAGRQGTVAPHASDSRRRGPLARLALTRRVLAALEPLEGAEVEADVENPALPADATAMPLLRTDLLIRALDLRIRVALLPGAEAEDVDADAVLGSGLAMLISNPETASIVVVADDRDLTCRIIEPFDRPDAVLTAEGPESDASFPRGGPVAPVLRAYLRQINPQWDPPARINPVSAEIDTMALQVAHAALTGLQSRRKNTLEWKEARQGLSQDDASWIRDQAIAVVLNDSDAESLATRLDERAARKP